MACIHIPDAKSSTEALTEALTSELCKILTSLYTDSTSCTEVKVAEEKILMYADNTTMYVVYPGMVFPTCTWKCPCDYGVMMSHSVICNLISNTCTRACAFTLYISTLICIYTRYEYIHVYLSKPTHLHIVYLTY